MTTINIEGEVYELRKLDESNIHDLCAAFNSIRKKDQSLTFFKKKYDSSWIGQKKYLGYLIYHNKKVVGFCGSTIYKLIDYQGKIYILGQFGDLFIDSDLRGKGIPQKGLRQFELLTTEQEIDGVFTFPSRMAQSLFEKAQWNNIGNFVTYQFNIRTYPLLKILNKFSIQRYFFRFAKLFGSTEFPKANHAKITDNKLKVIHDEQFFKYKKYDRYLFHQHNDYEFLWSLSDGILINSIDIATEEELEKKIKYLKRFCFLRGIHTFSIICHDKSRLNKLLSEQYKGNISLPIFIKSFNPAIDIDAIEFEGIDRNAF